MLIIIDHTNIVQDHPATDKALLDRIVAAIDPVDIAENLTAIDRTGKAHNPAAHGGNPHC